jgi:hypothetical protein
LAIALAIVCASGAAATNPALPARYVDSSAPLVTGKSIPVHAGNDLQAIYNSASCGSDIVLDAGATFTGNFVFNKRCTAPDWLVVRTSNLGKLPEGRRVSPGDAANMATIRSVNGGPPITTTNAGNVAGSYHYFAGLEVTSTASQGALVNVTNGLSETSAGQLASHIIFSRMYVHGLPSSRTVQMTRGFLLTGSYVALVDNYISSIYSCCADSQAILGALGPGPYRIHNNYVEAAGENIMFGGTGAPPGFSCNVASGPTAAMAILSSCVDSTGAPAAFPAAGTQVMFMHSGLSNPAYWTTIRSIGGGAAAYDALPGPPDAGNFRVKWGMIPADIEITQNTFFKSPAWNPANPAFDGVPRQVKNFLELKYGVRVLFNGNRAENMWSGAQSAAFNLNSTDQNGDCPWCRTTDVTLTNNVFTNLGPGAFAIIPAQTYAGGAGPPAPMARVLIDNNLFDLTAGPTILMAGFIGTGAHGGGVDSLKITHNTLRSTWKLMGLSDGTPFDYTNFVFRDNIIERGAYGIGYSAGPNEGIGFVRTMISPGGRWEADHNALANVSAGTDQANSNEQLRAAYGFMLTGPVATGDAGIGFAATGTAASGYHAFRLSPSSPFHNAASDGKDVGVDMSLLDSALSGNNCVMLMTPAVQDLPATGGSSRFTIKTLPGCEWTAKSRDEWVTITSDASGKAEGIVSYTVAANGAKQPRASSLAINGYRFVIYQASQKGSPRH